MVVPPIPAPYDSIPMIFLIPDKNGRKKVLKDLNDHLESFRTLCAKISDISSERAAADKFIQDLDAIDKNLSPAQYDNALASFMHAYGDPVSSDLQGFLGTSRSNLDKCQFLTQEFRNTNILVPAPASPVPAQLPSSRASPFSKKRAARRRRSVSLSSFSWMTTSSTKPAMGTSTQRMEKAPSARASQTRATPHAAIASFP